MIDELVDLLPEHLPPRKIELASDYFTSGSTALNSSELDNVGPGDCFRLSLWVWADGCELGTGCTVSSGTWVPGEQVWPAGFDLTPSSFGQVCLDPCEEEFVPEPGSVLLLGSGLAGLAGYATLRWRKKE